MSTYTKEEVAIVRGWVTRGMTMLNGREPYDRGAGTRKGSVLDYVFTTAPNRVKRVERDSCEGCGRSQLGRIHLFSGR